MYFGAFVAPVLPTIGPLSEGSQHHYSVFSFVSSGSPSLTYLQFVQ